MKGAVPTRAADAFKKERRELADDFMAYFAFRLEQVVFVSAKIRCIKKRLRGLVQNNITRLSRAPSRR